jgi:hypothetical protein
VHEEENPRAPLHKVVLNFLPVRVTSRAAASKRCDDDVLILFAKNEFVIDF